MSLSAAIIIIAAVSFIFLIKNANRIAKHELDQFLGKNFSVQEVRLKWNKVEALNVSYRNPEGKTVFHTDSLVLSSDFMGLLKKDYNVSSATLINPYLMLEKDKEGTFKNPFPSQKNKDENKPSSEFRIQKVEIINGSLDYVDDEVSGGACYNGVEEYRYRVREHYFPPAGQLYGLSLHCKSIGQAERRHYSRVKGK